MLDEKEETSEHDEEELFLSDDDGGEEEERVPTRKLLRAVSTGVVPGEEGEGEGEEGGESLKKKRQRIASELYEDSVYGLPRADTHESAATLADLTDVFRDSARFGVLKKRIATLTDSRLGPKSLSRPTEAVDEERAARAEGYAAATEQVALWQPIVRANREAEHLHFPLASPRDPQPITAMASRTKAPETELEKAVHQVLSESGVTESQIMKFEVSFTFDSFPSHHPCFIPSHHLTSLPSLAGQTQRTKRRKERNSSVEPRNEGIL